MGNMMLNHLGGGQGGIEHFFQQFTGPMTAWWKVLGQPVLPQRRPGPQHNAVSTSAALTTLRQRGSKPPEPMPPAGDWCQTSPRARVETVQDRPEDSAQKIIRIEQCKGRKDRNVMLSPETLDLLRQWWKVCPPRYDAGLPVQERWLFPSRKTAGRPMTTRQAGTRDIGIE
jgi:hypothetical protein